jgi:hypothetical protein
VFDDDWWLMMMIDDEIDDDVWCWWYPCLRADNTDNTSREPGASPPPPHPLHINIQVNHKQKLLIKFLSDGLLRGEGSRDNFTY